MTPDQCQSARKLLGWSRERLSRESTTSVEVISSYEIAGRMMSPRNQETGRDRVARMRAALEAGGVEFVDEIDGEIGVRLRKAESDDQANLHSGDIVQLKSGGPPMTLVKKTGDEWSTVWFVGDAIHQADFPAAALMPVDAGERRTGSGHDQRG